MEDQVTDHDGGARPVIDSERYGSAHWQIFQVFWQVLLQDGSHSIQVKSVACPQMFLLHHRNIPSPFICSVLDNLCWGNAEVN